MSKYVKFRIFRSVANRPLKRTYESRPEWRFGCDGKRHARMTATATLIDDHGEDYYRFPDPEHKCTTEIIGCCDGSCGNRNLGEFFVRRDTKQRRK